MKYICLPFKISILYSILFAPLLYGLDSQNIQPQFIPQQTGKAVGGIALFVNGEPITLYAIEKAQKVLNTDKLRATDLLVMEKLRESEIKRLKIDVTEAQVEAQISQIAQQNGMSLDQFYAAVMKEGMSLSEYRTKLQEQMLTQELMRKILFSSNIGQEDELRKYYNEHINEFIVPKEVESVKFVSNNKTSLENFIKQAKDSDSEMPSDIAKEEERIETSTIPSQIADILLITPEKKFSQVLESGNGAYVSFYIKQKIDTEQVSFDKVKNYIAQKLIANNQEKILNNYFERVRSRSKIVFVR